MNFNAIKGRRCRIVWSQRDASLRRSGVGNVFIKNLNKNIDNKALYDTFSAFGNILSCKIATDANGSKGYGFVHFETEEAAWVAIEKVNGMLLAGKTVFVEKFMSRKERLEQMGDKARKFTNVYVKNLPEDVTDEELTEQFSKYGLIVSAKIMTHDDGRHKGFGFVSFDSHEAAESCVQEMNGIQYKGRKLYVGRAQKKTERQAESKERFERLKLERMNRYQGVNLYVKNLDDVIDDEQLCKEFSQYGNITSAEAVHVPGQEPLTAAMLAQASASEQKQMLGERLFPLISTMHAEVAGKITGMLLEIDNTELLHMLESPESLKAKDEDFKQKLNNHCPRLINELDVTEVFLSYFIQGKVLMCHNVETILSKATAPAKAMEFFNIMQRRGFHASDVMHQALMKTDQTGLAALFKPDKIPLSNMSLSHGMSHSSRDQVENEQADLLVTNLPTQILN